MCVLMCMHYNLKAAIMLAKMPNIHLASINPITVVLIMQYNTIYIHTSSHTGMQCPAAIGLEIADNGLNSLARQPINRSTLPARYIVHCSLV